jgi:hypothetical protein
LQCETKGNIELVAQVGIEVGDVMKRALLKSIAEPVCDTP